MEKYGAIDYLINNAAIFGDMKIEGYLNVDMDYLDRFMRVNAHGCLIMTRAVVEHMTAGGGGPTETGALEKMAGDYAREMVKSIPIKRLGQPGDLAGAALFLLSDEASWITSYILNVDGGQFMRP